MSSQPVAQRPLWIARGMMAGLVALVVIVQFLSWEVSTVESGSAVVYTSPLLFPIISAVLALGPGVAAFFFWRARQAHPFFRFFAAMLTLVSLFQLFNAPNALSYRLIVTPESFELRTGPWYSPIDTKVDYKNVAYVQVVDADRGGYDLYVISNDSTETSVHIGDLLKAALPEVLEAMARHDVLIADRPDGWKVPEDLLP